MRLTLEQPSYKRTVIIEEEDDDLNLDDVFQKLVEPAIVALGFSQEAVSAYIEGKEDDR